MAGVDIVERMENRASGHLRICRDDSPCHPVMAVDDQAAAVFRADPGNDLIDQGLLEFRRIQYGIPGIGVGKIVEDRRIHQMDAVRVDRVGDPVPLVVIEMVLLLEPTAQIQRGKMTFDAPVGQSFAEGRNHLAHPAALARYVRGQRPHITGQASRLRCDLQDNRLFSDRTGNSSAYHEVPPKQNIFLLSKQCIH